MLSGLGKEASQGDQSCDRIITPDHPARVIISNPHMLARLSVIAISLRTSRPLPNSDHHQSHQEIRPIAVIVSQNVIRGQQSTVS